MPGNSVYYIFLHNEDFTISAFS